MKHLYLIIFILSALASCAPISWNRSYIEEMEKEDAYFTPDRDFKTVSGDRTPEQYGTKGLEGRVPASIRDRELSENERQLKSELKQRESELSVMERERYLRINSQFENDSERLYYLGLSARERDDYVQSRGLAFDTGNFPYKTTDFWSSQDRYSKKDINLGMAKSEVLDRWGRPHRVDVAGNPQLENERWAFFDNGKVRYLFFERGRVDGWSFD